MAIKVPIRTVYDNSNNAIGLSEMQTGDAVGPLHGGTGLSSLGSAGQVLQINSGATGFEFGDKTSVNLNPYLQVSNANVTFITKATALSSNNALINLINDRMQIANVQSLVTTSINNVIDAAPGALDTLNELAAAIGDDANFITTINSSINQRLASNATITLNGDISGSGSFSSNSVTITTDLGVTGTPTGTFGSSSKVPIITVSADGRITNISNTDVAGVESVSYNTSNGLLTINTSDGSSQTANITLQPFDTDNLTEGATNLYFTTARARSAFSAGDGIAITDGTIALGDPAFPTGDYGLITDSDFQTLGDEIATSEYYDLSQTPKAGLVTIDLGSNDAI